MTNRDKEFEKLIAIAKEKELSNEKRDQLLQEIRNGNREPITELVDSLEMMVISIAKQIPTEIPTEELIAVGKNELTKLAGQEINSEARERFFRFGAWCVRQALLKEKMNRE